MAYLLKHCQLLLHQSSVDFSFVDFCLLNYFYSTLLLNLQVCSEEYFAELTRTELFLERVKLVHIVNLMEAFELLELYESCIVTSDLRQEGVFVQLDTISFLLRCLTELALFVS